MSAALAAAPAAMSAGQGIIRVMVVDDSVVVRGLVARWLGEEPELKVVASLRTGQEAVDQLERADPDVVILDIEMPELDGLSALPLLLAKRRDLVVIMASTLTRRHAEISFKALSMGAADYVPKPDSNRGITTSAEFRRELVDKIRHLGRRRQRADAAGEPRAPLARAPGAAGESHKGADGAASSGAAAAPLTLRPWSARMPRVLLVGSSTGGPQALTTMLSGLGSVTQRVPVLVAQHMPPTFTTILAEHLSRASGRSAREAQTGELIKPGHVYVAPGGRHMLVGRRQGQPAIELDDGPAVNFCKPAVDPLFTSASAVWGNATLAVVLTGMGADGARGAEDIAAAGGSVIAQDEATSVVWGMPGSVAHAGVCSAVLPLDQIAPRVVRVFSGDLS